MCKIKSGGGGKLKVIETKRICTSIHQRVFYIRIDPEDIHDTLSHIFDVLSNLSWISTFDANYIQTSFRIRAESTITDIQEKLKISLTDEVSGDAGEYVVSELAREAIVEKMAYLDIPLAELYNKKKSGNPGFDYHSQSKNATVIFGEAKYLDGRNAYGTGLKQVVKFIEDKKDIKDIVDLRDFCTPSALSRANDGIKGFAIAFSAKDTTSEILLANIKKNKEFNLLLAYDEIILVAVNI